VDVAEEQAVVQTGYEMGRSNYFSVSREEPSSLQPIYVCN